jgi:hypothetical protein
MSEKKGRGIRRSDRPPGDVAGQLKARRAEFVQTFFKKGAELTEELVRENGDLRRRLGALERENASLKTQLASDTAIRDLLAKIRQLEKEKDELLSSMHEHEAATGRYANRFHEIESELENFANLYVASYQLHSTLRLPLVMRHMKELLLQLVGVESLAFYVAREGGRELAPVASEGIELGALPPVAVHEDHAEEEGAAARIERVFLTGIAAIEAGDVAAVPAGMPVACVPMHFDDRVIGVIVIFALLEQKSRFVAVDYELFKLLGAHAGTALVGGLLFALADGRLPRLDSVKEQGT